MSSHRTIINSREGPSTPARNTRSASRAGSVESEGVGVHGELPALASGVSQAYGAAGRVPLSQRIRVHEDQSSFANQFDDFRTEERQRSFTPQLRRRDPNWTMSRLRGHVERVEEEDEGLGDAQQGHRRVKKSRELDDLVSPTPEPPTRRERVLAWLRSNAISIVMALCILTVLCIGLPLYLKFLTSNVDSSIANMRIKLDSVWPRLETSEKAIKDNTKQLRFAEETSTYIRKYAHLLENTYKELHEINWFGTNQGAVVDPFLSSPTKYKKRSALSNVYASLVSKKGGYPMIKALEPWREAGDCWCASPPKKYDGLNNDEHADWNGVPKAQLAVVLNHIIYPREIIVEHIPQPGTPDHTAAPKSMELWVSVEDSVKRKALAETSEFMFRKKGSKRNAAGDSNLGLDDTYVLVARWKYELGGDNTPLASGTTRPNHVQRFPVVVNPAEEGAGIFKAVVRANTNYGQDYTCLYRVRVTGTEAPDERPREKIQAARFSGLWKRLGRHTIGQMVRAVNPFAA